MSRLIKPGEQPRRLLGKLHRWSGLTVFALLFLTAATGAVLAFQDELDAMFNPHLFQAHPETAQVPLGSIIATLEASHPGLRVSSVNLPQSPDETLRFYMRQGKASLDPSGQRPLTPQDTSLYQAFVDPYSGALLGVRNISAFALDRVNLIPTLHRLHYSLFLEKWGAWLLGGCAVIWFLSSWLGLALAWPRRLAPRTWRSLLSVRWRQGTHKLNYDLHRAIGLLSLPVLAVVAFTAIYLNLTSVMRPLISVVSPLGTTPSLGPVTYDAPMTTPEAAIAQAQALLPGSRAALLQRNFNQGIYSVRLKLPGDVGRNGDHVVWVAMTDGSIVGKRLASERSGGDTFIAWMLPLHNGAALGPSGRFLIFIAALALAALCITGMSIWLRRQRGESKLAGKHAASVP